MLRKLLAVIAHSPHSVVIASALTIFAVLLSGIVAQRNAREQDEMAQVVIHTHRVLGALNQIETTMIDAETGQRGYLLTGDEHFLEPYWAATGSARVNVINRPSIAALLREVERTEPAARGGELLRRIRSLVDAKLAELDRTIALHRAGQAEEARRRVQEGHGKRVMDTLRITLSTMRAQQRQALVHSERRRDAVAGRAVYSAALLCAASLFTVALLILTTQASARSLRRSEQRFRSLVEASAAVVWSAGPDGALAGTSASWTAFSGQSAWRQRGYGWMAMVHRGDREALRRAWSAGREAGLPWEVPCRLRDHSGRFHDMVVRGVPIFEHGAVSEWVGTCSDVTELVRAQYRLRRFAESDLIGIMFSDEHGNIDYANDEYLRIMGYPRGHLRDPRNVPAVGSSGWVVRCRGQVATGGDETAPTRYEIDYERPDGQRLALMVGMTTTNPEHTQAIAFVLDLTAQKQAEHALREQQQDFRMLAENMSQHAWTAQADGSGLWFNRRWEEYTGLGPAAIAVPGWQKLVHHPDHQQRVSLGFRRALEAGEPWEDIFPLRRADGAYRWFLSRALPIRDERGRIVRWFGTNTDIDDRLRLEQELKEANRRKDEFIATLAHELRNPLAPVQAGVELMKMTRSLPPQLLRTRDIMDRQLAHLVRLIDDLLDVSRITSGKLDLQTAVIPVKAILDSALEVSRLHIESARHELEVALPPQPLAVDGDLVRLAQVVTNLLNNAAKYTPDGGRIRLAVEQDGHDVLLRVSDNGIGIEAAVLPNVFDLFSQAHGAREQRQGGIGVGLSIARQLVEMHGGSLTAQSAGLGHGSTFTVRLPLAAQPAPAQPLAPSAAPAVAGCKRILILDDNEDAALTLATLLELGGHELRVAHTGQQAIDAARAFRPDIALLDIGLPDISGHDVARALRADPALAGIRLVALTGWGGPQDRLQSRDAGFDHHLTKPVTIGALQEVLPDVTIPA